MTETGFVCAWCDVYNRKLRDENGVVFQISTVCAYRSSTRAELRAVGGDRGNRSDVARTGEEAKVIEGTAEPAIAGPDRD